VTLNPTRLALFTDWAKTLPPRPLPRTITPVPGEYYLDYISRLADANHLELLELTGALDDPAAVILDPGRRKQHRQERLAAAASQPLARIARLYWDDHGDYLRDPDRFGQLLRPACRRCTARLGIAGPVACRLPPHLTICRRHRLWIGPAARTHAGAATLPSCATTSGRTWTPLSAPLPVPSTRPCAPASGYRASGSACNSSLPASGNRPWPACSAPAPAGQTAGPATPPSRSRYTPTSSGSPHAASGSTAPATAPRPDAPASGPTTEYLTSTGIPSPAPCHSI
jgi:hypothetical protein